MTAVRITGETLAGTPDLPLLVCGPGPSVPVSGSCGRVSPSG